MRSGRAGGPAPTAGGAAGVRLTAGCGGSDSSSRGTPPPGAEGLGEVTVASDGVQEVTLQTQDDYVFTPDSFTVAPGQVRLTVVNIAEQTTHNLRFTPGDGPAPIQPEISLLAPGESRTIEFAVTAPGDYGFECSFHTQLGQFGTMTVSG